MSKRSKWATAGGIVGLATLMVVLTWSGSKTETLLYYDRTANQCYSAAVAYHRYAVHIDPEDFGIDTKFRITHVIASASITPGLSVPFLISDAYPPKYPDSSLYRQDVTFMTIVPEAWDTFALDTPMEWKKEFWIQFIYTSWSFNPFSESEPEDSTARERNIVESTYGWGPNECNMALGVIIETPTGFGYEEYIPGLPKAFVLYQNYPNPFNPVTTIGFSLERQSRATLSVYSSRGRLIETLLDRPLTPGKHEVVWKGGDTVNSGVYFYQLMVEGRAAMKRMLLTK